MVTRNPFDLPAQGKLLALDSGAVRVGVAASDTSRRMAVTKGIVDRQPWATLKTKISAWKTEGCVAAVVGYPLNMDGTPGPSADAATSLASLIEKECGLPVLLWDERLTSRQAEGAFFEQRIGRMTRGSKKASVGHIDSGAAVILLNNVLDALRRE